MSHLVWNSGKTFSYNLFQVHFDFEVISPYYSAKTRIYVTTHSIMCLWPSGRSVKLPPQLSITERLVRTQQVLTVMYFHGLGEQVIFLTLSCPEIERGNYFLLLELSRVYLLLMECSKNNSHVRTTTQLINLKSNSFLFLS